MDHKTLKESTLIVVSDTTENNDTYVTTTRVFIDVARTRVFVVLAMKHVRHIECGSFFFNLR